MIQATTRVNPQRARSDGMQIRIRSTGQAAGPIELSVLFDKRSEVIRSAIQFRVTNERDYGLLL